MSQFRQDKPVLEPAAQAFVEATTNPLSRTTLMRRILKHPHLRHYNRLIALIMAANLVPLTYGLTRGEWWSSHGIALKAIVIVAIANFALAIILRQPYVINFLHWLATRAPTTWPLKLRWTLAKVYHFGGLHVGAAVSGTLWYLVFVSSLTYDAVRDPGNVWVGNAVVSYALLTLLVVIVVMALPPLRARAHDTFEMTHRFCGWAALVLVWANTVLFVSSQRGAASVASALLTAPTIWMLVVTTTSIALPWLLLRKVPVTIERPSSHVALVSFDHGVTPLVGSVRPISRNPLLGWHAFANIPAPGQSPGGYRMAVSRAGDWTGAFIDDPPSHVWVRGIPTAGMANVNKLFKKVVYVATGSGIGPTLAHLLANEVPSHLVWVTRSPARPTATRWLTRSWPSSPTRPSGIQMSTASPTWSGWRTRRTRPPGSRPSSASRTRRSPGRSFTAWSVSGSRRAARSGTRRCSERARGGSP